MRRLLPVLLIAILVFPFRKVWPDDDQGGRSQIRISTLKILDMTDLVLSKGTGPTSFVYQFKPSDSIKIKCEECMALMDEQKLSVALRSGGGDPVVLTRKQMNTWIPIENPLGKFGLVFTRDNSGDRLMDLDRVEVWRKTPLAPKKLPTSQYTMTDGYGIFVEKIISDLDPNKTKLKYRLNKLDKIKVSIMSSTGSPVNLGCWWFREGEDFAPIPVPNDQWFEIPGTADPSAYYIFEFANLKEDKENENLYNIRVERIPAPPDYGPRAEVIDTSSGDTLVDEPGLTPEQQILKDLLDEIRKNSETTFECSTFEGELDMIVQPELNLSPTQSNRQCIEIPLSGECALPEDCPECESIWVFWIGAGNRKINTFQLRDSTGKVERGMGLMEAFAEGYIRSGKDRDLSGKGIFPIALGSEDVFFTIIPSVDTTRFLTGNFNPVDWTGDGKETTSSGGFVSDDYGVLTYNPEKSLSLCTCNNNRLSPVPLHFRFQQFLHLPEVVPEIEAERPL